MPYAARRLLYALCLPLAAGYAETRTTLVREGASWVETTTGTVNIADAGRLQVSTRGAIVLRGQTAGSVIYTLRQRVRARSEDEARRLLGQPAAQSHTRGDWTVLVLLPSDANGVDADLKLAAPRGLRETILETRGGAVDVADMDGSIRVETAGGNIHLDRIGRSATVKTGGGEIRVGRINGSLRCLSSGGSIRVDHTGGETWCETAGGEITVRDAGGPLHVSTEGGNVEVARAAGSVSASSVAGLIEVKQAGGPVHAETKGGSIQVGSAHGAQCESAAGTIRVKSVSGSLRIVTASGSILAQLISGVSMQDSFLSTGGGDITVLIPSNLAV
ncbi:MAG: DUF4097 family beta strand repeat-containing protein, partial [Bryobacteraceae bacterium]